LTELIISAICISIYAGPAIPLSCTLFLGGSRNPHFKSNMRWLLVLGSVQAASLLVYAIPAIFGVRDAVHNLIVPAITGVALFLGGWVCFSREARAYIKAKRPPNAQHGSEDSGAAKDRGGRA